MKVDSSFPPFVDLRSGIVSNADLGDVDPDIVLIADYLADELSDEDSAAVEERLVRDAAFFDRMSPLIALADAARRARDEAAETADVPRALPVMGRRVRFALQAAAAVLATVALPVALELITPTAARRRVEVLAASEHRAATASFWRPEMFQVSDSLAGAIDAGRGVRVFAAAGARVTVDRFRLPGAAARIAIDGDARVEIPPGARARVVTAGASMELERGSYRVHSPTAEDARGDVRGGALEIEEERNGDHGRMERSQTVKPGGRP